MFYIKIFRTSGENVETLANDMRILSHIVSSFNAKVFTSNYKKIQNLLEESGFEIPKLLDDLSPTCDEMIQKCMWKGEGIRCQDVFERITTTMGYCCAFNYFAIGKHNFSRWEISRNKIEESFLLFQRKNTPLVFPIKNFYVTVTIFQGGKYGILYLKKLGNVTTLIYSLSSVILML